jgi:RNA polymerase sigma-70 factor (ECF subfamily)
MTQFPGTFPACLAITRQMPATADAGTVEPSDLDLMRRTAAGDREAFAALYRRHHAMVFRFARLMTGSGAVAEDIVQEVFLVIMRNAARYDDRRSALSTYLYGVARHQTRRRLARERRFVGLDEKTASRRSSADELTADLERRNDVQRLRCAILSLPSRYREVVVLCDLHDLSYADAAATIGCALGTVRSRLHRARQLLGEKMRRSECHHSPATPPSVRYAV